MQFRLILDVKWKIYRKKRRYLTILIVFRSAKWNHDPHVPGSCARVLFNQNLCALCSATPLQKLWSLWLWWNRDDNYIWAKIIFGIWQQANKHINLDHYWFRHKFSWYYGWYNERLKHFRNLLFKIPSIRMGDMVGSRELKGQYNVW